MKKNRKNFAATISIVALTVVAMLLVPYGAASSPAQSQRQELERSLPAGQSPHFYWGVMEAMGYAVQDIDYAKHSRVTFDVARDGQFYRVMLALEDSSTRVDRVDITTLDDNGYADDRHDNGVGHIEAGTRVPVELRNYVSSDESARGDRFSMLVTETVDADLPRGTIIEGEVVNVEPADRPRRSGKLVLDATAIRFEDRTVPLSADITAEGDRSEADEGVLDDLGDLKDVGIGAAVGGIIGGIIKGTKGALVGLIIGGAGTFLATEGDDVELPAGTPLIVEISHDVELR